MAPSSTSSGQQASASLQDQAHPSPAPLPSQKRSRAQSPPDHLPDERPDKRLRTFHARPIGPGDEEENAKIPSSYRSYIEHWAEAQEWPRAFFQDSLEHLYAKKKPSKPRLKPYEANQSAPAAPRQEGEESASFEVPSYHVLLETQGNSYMKSHENSIRDQCKDLCQQLLENKQPLPPRTIFDDDVFEATCNRLRGKNKERIMKDLTPLIVPSAEPLATLGAQHLDVVIESVNEAWENCIKITSTCLQPDYSVGFLRSAFSDEQFSKLQPYLGTPTDTSYFMATQDMHFPFMACQVKSGTEGLDVADRENAQCMTVALRGIVTLFRALKREQEIHRRLLGFSIAHDQESVRIWGHYAAIEELKTTFWRHPIRSLNFTKENGLEKWTANTFTRNLYDMWVPLHFKLICSAVDNLPVPRNHPSDSQPQERADAAKKRRETWSIDVGLPKWVRPEDMHLHLQSLPQRIQVEKFQTGTKDSENCG